MNSDFELDYSLSDSYCKIKLQTPGFDGIEFWLRAK